MFKSLSVPSAMLRSRSTLIPPLSVQLPGVCAATLGSHSDHHWRSEMPYTANTGIQTHVEAISYRDAFRDMRPETRCAHGPDGQLTCHVSAISSPVLPDRRDGRSRLLVDLLRCWKSKLSSTDASRRRTASTRSSSSTQNMAPRSE